MKQITKDFLELANFVSHETHKRQYPKETLEVVSKSLVSLDKHFREQEDPKTYEKERLSYIEAYEERMISKWK